MAPNQEHMILNGNNYGIWAQNMETLLKSKILWQFTKATIVGSKDDQHKFIFDKKKDGDIRVNTTHMLKEIHFHSSMINWHYQL